MTRIILLLAILTAATLASEPQSSHAIFKSNDRCRTWFRSDKGLPGNSRINAFGSLDESFFAGADAGIFISRDEGRSWQPARYPHSTSNRIICFAVLDRMVFAGTDKNGLLVSSDKGITWSFNLSFPSKMTRCLLSHQGKLYAGTDADGVLVSSDSGLSWTRINRGLPDNSQVFAMSRANGSLFAGLYSKGLYRWDNPGQSWVIAGGVSPLALTTIGATLVAGHNPGGIYWSDDLGEKWAKASIESMDELAPRFPEPTGEGLNDNPVWELASNDTLGIAGVSSGIYYSEDKGRTWTRALSGLPAESPGVAFLLKRDFILASTPIKETKVDVAPDEGLPAR